MPNVFILTWNPTKWEIPEANRRAEARRTARGRKVRGQWSVGGRTGGIEPGDIALLLRQQSERGLVAGGVFTSAVFQEPHWDGSRREANYATVLWDVVVPTEERLSIEALKDEVPEVAWDRLQGSGVKVPDGAAERLVELWCDHTGRAPYRSPEDVPIGGTFREGDVTTVRLNRYERDRRARAACIAHHGSTCSVCDIEFGAVYGRIGDGFIHVHHLTELSELGEGAQVDPVRDLRPVCPNCHAMLHRRRPAFTIDELRGRLRA